MREAALLAVVDAVAWLRSLRARVQPAVDLPQVLGALEDEAFEELCTDSRVASSQFWQNIAGLERLRRQEKIESWAYVQILETGSVRLKLVPVAGARSGEKMVVLQS